MILGLGAIFTGLVGIATHAFSMSGEIIAYCGLALFGFALIAKCTDGWSPRQQDTVSRRQPIRREVPNPHLRKKQKIVLKEKGSKDTNYPPLLELAKIRIKLSYQPTEIRLEPKKRATVDHFPFLDEVISTLPPPQIGYAPEFDRLKRAQAILNSGKEIIKGRYPALNKEGEPLSHPSQYPKVKEFIKERLTALNQALREAKVAEVDIDSLVNASYAELDQLVGLWGTLLDIANQKMLDENALSSLHACAQLLPPAAFFKEYPTIADQLKELIDEISRMIILDETSLMIPYQATFALFSEKLEKTFPSPQIAEGYITTFTKAFITQWNADALLLFKEGVKNTPPGKKDFNAIYHYFKGKSSASTK